MSFYLILICVSPILILITGGEISISDFQITLLVFSFSNGDIWWALCNELIRLHGHVNEMSIFILTFPWIWRRTIWRERLLFFIIWKASWTIRDPKRYRSFASLSSSNFDLVEMRLDRLFMNGPHFLQNDEVVWNITEFFLLLLSRFRHKKSFGSIKLSLDPCMSEQSCPIFCTFWAGSCGSID